MKSGDTLSAILAFLDSAIKNAEIGEKEKREGLTTKNPEVDSRS